MRRSSRATGLTVHEVAVGPPTFEAGADAVDAVVATPATAVVAFNAQMALGVVAGLARRGHHRCPDEISVVGGDDVPMAPMTAPPLTAISLPTEEAGAAAIERLRRGRAATSSSRRTFVARGSTAPVSR